MRECMSSINIHFRKEKMNTASKLKLCNRFLGCVIVMMLASGIQLEVTSGQYVWSVWLHIILGILLTVLSVYHIFLHYRHTNWFTRFRKNRRTATRILWWVFLLTVISGIAATVSWLNDGDHSHLGAVHGKIGFLMVVLAITHVIKNLKKKNPRSTIAP